MLTDGNDGHCMLQQIVIATNQCHNLVEIVEHLLSGCAHRHSIDMSVQD